MRKTTPVIIINNIEIPAPDEGYNIVESTLVDSARNTKGVVVGQVIRDNIWKIDNLQWSSLTPEEWATLKNALSSFYVTVTFTDDYNVRRTMTMYPGDRTSTPCNVTASSQYGKFKTCKFNLIEV